MDDRPFEVEPGLFIGSFMAEQNKAGLKRAGITHVLQVADGLSPSHPNEFTYLSISVQDMPGRHKMLAACLCCALLLAPPELSFVQVRTWWLISPRPSLSSTQQWL